MRFNMDEKDIMWVAIAWFILGFLFLDSVAQYLLVHSQVPQWVTVLGFIVLVFYSMKKVYNK